MNSVHEQFRRSFLGLLLAVVLWERWSLMTPSSQRLEQISLDFRYSFFSPFHAPSQKVVFVDINEESLAAINKSEGPWPWKRDIWKDSVHLLSLGQPKAILFDVLLTESDKLNLSSDKKFAETIKKIPFVSLPLSFETTQNQQKDRLPASNRPFDLDIENKKTAADMFGTFSRPYSPLWESLSHVHVVNAIKDNDGKFRSTPFFFNYNSEIFPSLTLKALQIYLSDPK